MPAVNRRSDGMKFDPSRLVPPNRPGKALIDAINDTLRNPAGRAAASKVAGMDGAGAAGARATFSGLTSAGAAQALPTRLSIQATAGAIAERNGSALTRGSNQSHAVGDVSALSLTGGIGVAASATAADSIWEKGLSATVPTNTMMSPGALSPGSADLRSRGIAALANSMRGTHITRLPKHWDGPNGTVRSALSAVGGPEAMHAPSKAWESQRKTIEVMERRLASWDAAQGSRGPMIDLPPPPLPREDLSIELSRLRRAATEAGEAVAADRRAQVERDEEMVRAVRAMEGVLVESAECEALSTKRAEEAEAREIAAQARSEELNARLVKLTVQLVVLTCISVIASVFAVFAVVT